MQANPRVEYATIVNDTVLLTESHVDSKPITNIVQGTQVEILEDKTTIWYRVRHAKTDEIGWIQRKYLELPFEEPSNKTRMSQEHIEAYINLLSFQSKTNYFVWVDLQRQVVNILEGEKGNFRLTNVLPCSSGKAEIGRASCRERV